MAVSKAKARKILADGTIRGRRLTARQRGYFGAIAGGSSTGPRARSAGAGPDEHEGAAPRRAAGGRDGPVQAGPEARPLGQDDAETRLEPGGLLVLSNARYGPEDLSHQVSADFDLEQPGQDGEPRPLYVQISFRAHYEDRCTGDEHTGPWPNGCLLNPSRASYRRMRHFMVRNEGRFRLVWQQEDTDPRGFLAQRVWFTGGRDSTGFIAPGCLNEKRRMGQLPDRADATRPAVSVLSIDPSSSHWWAIEHWLIYPDERQVLLRGLRAALKTPELLYPSAAGGWGVEVARSVAATEAAP